MYMYICIYIYIYVDLCVYPILSYPRPRAIFRDLSAGYREEKTETEKKRDLSFSEYRADLDLRTDLRAGRSV